MDRIQNQKKSPAQKAAEAAPPSNGPHRALKSKKPKTNSEPAYVVNINKKQKIEKLLENKSLSSEGKDTIKDITESEG